MSHKLINRLFLFKNKNEVSTKELGFFNYVVKDSKELKK